MMNAEQVMVFRVVRATGAVEEIAAELHDDRWWVRRAWPHVSDETPRGAVLAYCHHNDVDVREIVLPGQETGVEMGARMIGEAVAHVTATLTRERDAARSERDAALAAVDAVRVDYAPRRDPPTVDEVRALARLWEMCSAPALIRTSRGFSVAHVTWLADGGIAGWCMPDARTIKRAETWLMLGPDGPVAWSQLAAMVAQVQP